MKATVNIGGPVHVTRLGAGSPMVLVHGLGSSHVHWLGVSGALARTHRLLIPDLPGFGLTPLAGRRVDVEANARLLVRLLESIGEPVVLVGNSMGALISLLAAQARPAAVDALVLVATPAPRPLLTPLEPRLFLLFSAYAWPGLGELTRETLVRFHGPEGMARNLLETGSSAPDQAPREVVDAARRLAARRPHHDEVHAFLEAYRSTWTYVLNGPRFDSLLRSIEAPTLVIQGSADRLVPAVVSNRLPRVRPDWSYARLEGSGHLAQVDDPAGFVAALEGWLNRAGRRRRAVS